MRTMRIAQVTGGVDLMRFNLTHQIYGDVNIIGVQWFFTDSPGLIERKIEEMQILARHTATSGTCDCLTTTDQGFCLLDFVAVDLSGFLVL